ncbi:MAG: S-methyl-5-thioribose kinase [Campylobacterales bacterium]|nr:S-methyl-5-thioribose kinase [Campylobacterales bacterium]
MSYQVLDVNSVTEYAKSTPNIANILGEGIYKAQEVGDGNLNLVFIVCNPTNGASVVIKQALPYLRCVGESFPLGEQRMLFEIRSMLTYSHTVPSLVPQIFHSDESKYTLAMQNLSEHIIMRKGILEQKVYPRFADDITDFIAKTTFSTSTFGMDSMKRTKLAMDFATNTELRKLTEDFVFTFPYMHNETNRHNPLIEGAAKHIKTNGEFKAKAMELKYIFMTKAEALLHGDLHTGSVMLNEKETFVIDSEFAFLGPIGFDLGAVVGNLLMASLAMKARNKDEYGEWLESTAYDVMDKFASKYETLLIDGEGAMYDNKYWHETGREHKVALAKKITSDIIKESIGFAGCKMARRQLGVAHILEIDSIEDDKMRAAVETKVLDLAKEMVINYQNVKDAKELKQLLTDAK